MSSTSRACWPGSGTPPSRCSRCRSRSCGSPTSTPPRDASPASPSASPASSSCSGSGTALGATSLTGNLLCLGAAASYGLGFPYARRYLARRPEGPLSLATAQLICATVELAILTPIFTHAPHGLAAKHVLSIVALGVFGTGLTFVLNYSLVRDVGATVTSTVAYTIPIVSTLLGIVALGEPLEWYEPLGAAIIVVGAVLAQARDRPGAQAVTVSPRSARTSRSETLLPAKAARSSRAPWVK